MIRDIDDDDDVGDDVMMMMMMMMDMMMMMMMMMMWGIPIDIFSVIINSDAIRSSKLILLSFSIL